MNIIVTGYKGFIGGALYASLHNNVDTFRDIFDDSNIKIFGVELEDVYKCSKRDSNNPDNFYIDEYLFKNYIHGMKPDIIFHVGACSDTLNTNVNYMMNLNYESTRILSEYCYDNNVVLVFSSSAAIYGNTYNATAPINLYAWTKYISENIVVKNKGICLRYFNVYGPGEDNKGRMASVMYQAFAKSKSSKNKFGLYPGSPTRDFIYVDDVVNANLHILLNNKHIQHGIYDVGTGTSSSFEKIMHHMKIDWYHLNKEDIPTNYQFFTESDKKKWLVGWTPKFTLEKGIEEYMKYLNNKTWLT